MPDDHRLQKGEGGMGIYMMSTVEWLNEVMRVDRGN